jgi:dihydroorotase
VTVLELSRKQQVDPKRFESKGRATPFAGAVLKGWPAMTVVAGKVVFGERGRA